MYYLDEKGYFRYFTGDFKTIEDAIADIARLKLTGAVPVMINRLLLKKGNPFENIQVFCIQVDALKEYRDPSYYKNKFKLREDVFFFEKDEEFKYVVGTYLTMEEARNAMQKLGLQEAFPVLVPKNFLRKKR
jgi:hypothetical protein